MPGSTDRDRGYWRDVGTIGSYYAAHMDLVSPLPVFNLYNFDWPIYTSYGPQPPVKITQGEHGPGRVGARVRALARGRGQRRRGVALGALAGDVRRRRGRGRPTRC